MTLEEEVKVIVAALEDKKAEDVRTYDVRGVSGLCDAFVVATGAAGPHLNALLLGVQKALQAAGAKCSRVSGDSDASWLILDFTDVIVHVFTPEGRAYYALEKLWASAKPVEF